MSDSLIINARHHLRWHQRLVSDASTAMLWGGWLWLWRPLLNAFNWLSSLGVQFQHLLKLSALGSPFALEGSVVALAGTSGTLLLWNLLPARKARHAGVQTLQDYARHFDLPTETILAGRASSVCVVHHDEHGRIVRIEPRS